MSAIGYLVAKQNPSPAILFDNIKGYEKSPFKARSYGTFWVRASRGSRSRWKNHPTHQLSSSSAGSKTNSKLARCPRKFRRQAGFFENTLTGDKIDLTQLPIPKHWPLDGGRYAGTADW